MKELIDTLVGLCAVCGLLTSVAVALILVPRVSALERGLESEQSARRIERLRDARPCEPVPYKPSGFTYKEFHQKEK